MVQFRISGYSSLYPSIRVFQFWFPNTTWAIDLELGLTALTAGHSLNMASKSVAFRVFIVPEALRTPQERRLPALTQTVLSPRLAISS